MTTEKPMSDDEFVKLAPGDIVRAIGDDEGYVVTANYGGRATAVRTMDITHPDEWILVSKAKR